MTFPFTVPEGPTSGAQVLVLIESLTDWLFAGFMLLAVIFIIIATTQFLAQGGDPNSVSKARYKLIWAVVAIIIAVLAKGIPIVLRAIVVGT